MSIQDNKAIVRSLIDGLFTDGDLSAVDTYLAADCVLTVPPGDGVMRWLHRSMQGAELYFISNAGAASREIGRR